MNLKRCLSFGVVCIITFFLALVPTSFFGVDPLTNAPLFTLTQQRVIAIFVFTALMWILEVIPTWTTSVVAIVAILLTTSNKGIGFLIAKENVGALTNYKDVMAAFADPVIMLFLGGFVLAFAATKVGLDVQLAKIMLKPFGTNPKFVLLGVLLVIGVFSMFMSNTATAAMMLTFLTPVLATLPKDGGGRISLALAIPIAANLGGMGTPIGTPPNAIALGALQDAGYGITFLGWALRMIPFVIVMLVFAWVLLMKLYPFKAKSIELKIEGEPVKVTPFQKYVVWFTFALTIVLWMGEQWIGINSNIVAMIPFAVFSATGILKARHLEQINWAVLWMVAGGFALGMAMNGTGLAENAIKSIPFGSLNPIVILVISGLVCFALSNFISNTATAALLIPILSVVCKGMGDSLGIIGGTSTVLIGIAVSASCSMSLPISTPPNAIAYSTGLINQKDMAKVGLLAGVLSLIIGYVVLIAIGKMHMF